MSWIRKIFKKNEKTSELAAKEIYLVTWNTRSGDFSCSFEKNIKAFNSVEDAKNFMMKLKEAKEILRYRESIDIKIERQTT